MSKALALSSKSCTTERKNAKTLPTWWTSCTWSSKETRSSIIRTFTMCGGRKIIMKPNRKASLKADTFQCLFMPFTWWSFTICNKLGKLGESSTVSKRKDTILSSLIPTSPCLKDLSSFCSSILRMETTIACISIAHTLTSLRDPQPNKPKLSMRWINSPTKFHRKPTGSCLHSCIHWLVSSLRPTMEAWKIHICTFRFKKELNRRNCSSKKSKTCSKGLRTSGQTHSGNPTTSLKAPITSEMKSLKHICYCADHSEHLYSSFSLFMFIQLILT